MDIQTYIICAYYWAVGTFYETRPAWQNTWTADGAATCNSGLSWVIPEMYLAPSASPQQWLLLCQPTQHVANFPMRHISSLVSPVRWEKICLLCCPQIRKWKVPSSLQRNLHQWRMFILSSSHGTWVSESVVIYCGTRDQWCSLHWMEWNI